MALVLLRQIVNPNASVTFPSGGVEVGDKVRNKVGEFAVEEVVEKVGNMFGECTGK